MDTSKRLSELDEYREIESAHQNMILHAKGRYYGSTTHIAARFGQCQDSIVDAHKARTRAVDALRWRYNHRVDSEYDGNAE